MSRQVESFPDPLTFADGRQVSGVDEWLGPRRAELRGLFESEMYGRAPGAVGVGVLSREVLGGGLEQWEVLVDAPRPHRFDVLAAIPESSGPVPAVVALNFHGNHTVVADPGIRLPSGWVPETSFSEGNRASVVGRGGQADLWRVEETMADGFALFTAHYCAIEPDYPGALDGVRGAFGPEWAWEAVAAWGWGLSRILDLVLRDPRIDASRVGVAGHSRLGKAAVLAAAFDERFAFAAPVQAGCGGTAPSRGTVGESVRQITTAFPHWFAARFSEYADRVDELPFDQNALMAMVAPRPLLLANAEDDIWANPEGQLEALEEADRVFRLLGASGLGAAPRPLPYGVTGGNPAYFYRAGGHEMGAEDWRAVREFASIGRMG